MEWIGPVLIGILVFASVIQLFFAFVMSAIAEKTDQSDLMQILAWIPILQIAPMLEAGGGSIGRFLIGAIALGVGNAVMIAVALFLSSGLGNAIATAGLVLSGLLCLFYFGRIACNTAAARGLPAGFGLLLFVPIVNFFAYPYIAFHDGWVGPNKVGLAIGSVLILGSMAPSFQFVRLMNENGGLSPELLLAMNSGDSVDVDQSRELLAQLVPDASPPEEKPLPAAAAEKPVDLEKTTREQQTIRVLYQLKSRFDTLDALTTRENLLNHDHRTRALRILESIRSELELHRPKIEEETYAELATHLIDIESRVMTPQSSDSSAARRTASSSGRSPGPASIDPGGSTATPSFSDASTPPIRPYPVHASDDCPPGTEMRSAKRDGADEEWCQQLEAYGALRHGWYTRYRSDGRPESMGQYENGLRVGIWTRFHPTGEIRAQAAFREGLQHGWVLTFDPAGNRTRSARFEDGVRVEQK